MSSNLRRLGLGVSACLFAVALAACGGGSSSGSSSSGTTTPAGTPTTVDSGSGTTSNGITGLATTGDAKAHCDQITKADVQPMFPTQTITKVTVKAAGTISKGQSCLFSSADTSNLLFINVMSGQDATNAYQTDTIGFGSNAIAVSGIGDKAARNGSHSDPIVPSMQGDLYCSVLPNIDDFVGIQPLVAPPATPPASVTRTTPRPRPRTARSATACTAAATRHPTSAPSPRRDQPRLRPIPQRIDHMNAHGIRTRGTVVVLALVDARCDRLREQLGEVDIATQPQTSTTAAGSDSAARPRPPTPAARPPRPRPPARRRDTSATP